MSSPEINQVLAQMRAMAVQTQAPEVDKNPAVSDQFAGLLRQSIDAVAENQGRSSELRTAFEVGDPNVELAEVMVAAQKSSVSFQAMVQVRNKLLEAYKDVMNMPL